MIAEFVVTEKSFVVKPRTEASPRRSGLMSRFGGILKALLAGVALTLAGTAQQAYSYSQTINGVTWYYEFIPDTSNVAILKAEGQAAVVGATGNVTVPSKLGEYKVTRIGWYAFYRLSGITKVTIPSSITEIGDYAFCRCPDLASVSIPSSVTKIGQHAFQGTALTSVSMPGVKTIDELAFANCEKLASVTVPDGVNTIESYVFWRCNSLKTVTLPYGVKAIKPYAFAQCPKLETVFIPIGFIDVDAEQLRSVCFSEAPATMQIRYCGSKKEGSYTWYYQVVKEDDDCYAELRHIKSGSAAVSPTTATSLTIPSTIDGYTVKGLGQNAFRLCQRMTEVTIPSTVTTIGEQAFGSCSKLKKVTIPKGIKSIDRYAFNVCSSLESVEFLYDWGSTHFFTLDTHVFQDCGKLKSVTLPKTILGTIRDAEVFVNCASDLVISYLPTASVDLSLMVMAQIKSGQAWYFRIYNDDFYSVQLVDPGSDNSAKPMLNVTIPSTFTLEGDTLTVRSIGDYAFSNAKKLTGVTIPNTVTNIGTKAFLSCTGLMYVNIGNSVKSIGDYAFGNCTVLYNVTIPSSVTSIGKSAFWKCDALADVTIGSNVKSIGGNAFDTCASLKSVTVPDSVTSLGNYVFRECAGLTTASLPGSFYGKITESQMFQNCSSGLKIIYRGLTHRVTFNANGSGATVSPTSRDVEHGSTVGTLPTPSRSGYTFVGWYTASSGGTRVTTSYVVNGNVTFYAQWSQNPCKVTFNANGSGATVSPNTRNVTKGSAVGTLPTPTWSSHTFVGWYTASSGGTKVLETTTVNADVTYYAHWLQNYTVTFNANGSGATVSPTSKSVTSGYAVGTLPTPSWNNHTFIGWYTSANGGTVVSSGTTVSANVTYYAHWSLNTVTVTFNANGGTVSEPLRSVGIGTAVGNLPVPTHGDDYDFDGWYTAESGGTKVTASTTVNAAVTYYAHWTQRYLTETVDGYTWYYITEGGGTARIYKGVQSAAVEPAPTGVVTIPAKLGGMDVTSIGGDAFYGCSGMTGVVIPATVTTIMSGAFINCSGLTSLSFPYGMAVIGSSAFQGCSKLTRVDIPATVTEIGNYAFLDCSALNTVTFAGDCPTTGGDGIYTRTSTALESVVSATAAGWATYLASGMWQSRPIRAAVENVTVTFNANGGTVSETTRIVAKNAKIGVLPVPTRSGYTFNGWFTAATGGTKVTEATTVTGTVTYYAQWSQNFTVTFNANGGTVVPTTRIVKSGAEIGELPVPTRSGYTFNGWFTATTGGTKISATTKVTGNVTYYAQWTQTYPFEVVNGYTWYYVIESGNAKVFKTYGAPAIEPMPTGAVVIPTQLGGKPVTAIGGDAFYDCSGMTEVTIPATVTSIASSAFKGCSGLTSLALPSGLTAIMNSAFQDCSGLTRVEVPASLTTLGNYAFLRCTALMAVTYAGNCPTTNGENVYLDTPGDLVSYVKATASGWTSALASGTWLSRAIRSETVNVTVTFNPNGGTVSETTRTLTKGVPIGTLPNATRTGWVLKGWYTAATGGEKITESTTVNANATYYAQWMEPIPTTATVTFNPTGGTVSPTSKTISVNSSIGTLPTPTWSGYRFEGWFTAETDGSQVLSSTVFRNNTTIYAHWKKINCTVTLNPNGGTVSPTSRTVENGATVGSLPNATRSGYTFVGWFTEEGEAIYESTKVTDDVTYFAHWSESVAMVTVTFNANGGIVSQPSMDVEKDSMIGWLPTPVWADHSFNGWFTAATGGTQITETTKVTGNVTYYAQWTKINFTVTFNPNGGSATETSRVVAGGSEIGSLPDASRSGHTFEGWFTAATGGTRVTASTKVTKDVTYYAQWKANVSTVMVTFNANGGTVSPTSRTVTTGSPVGELPVPVWSGHSFQGWFTAAIGGEPVTSSFRVSANVVFFAQWTTDGYSSWSDPDSGITWIYRIVGGEAEIYNDGERAILPATVSGVVTVPTTLGGCPVTGIGDCAFLECAALEGVIIPDGVTSIGGWCFQDDTSLTSVVIPSTVTTIGPQAFCSSSLTSVTLPEGLTLTSGDTCVFADCNALAEVTIPSTLAIIPESTFSDCSSLSKVMLPDGVTTIADGAFSGCSSLTTMRIPKTVTSIGDDAFNGSALATVYVAAGDTARVKALVEGSGYLDPVTYIEESTVSCIVTFNPNGGIVTPAISTVPMGDIVGTLPTPTREGYTYIGWFTAEEGGSLISENTQVVGDVTFYAHWQEGTSPAPGPGPEPEPGDCYIVLNEGDITAPYSVPKAVTLRGAVYDGCDVAGVVELKLGKVNARKQTGKVSGSVTLLSGKKYTIKAKTANVKAGAPLTVSLSVKKLGTMTVTIGGGQFAGSLGSRHVQSAGVGGGWPKATATAGLTAVDLSKFPGRVLEELLPIDEVATTSKGKWVFKKAAGVKWTKVKAGVTPLILEPASGKGLVVDTAKGKTNISAIKLTYTPKTGLFKGSFKVYELQGYGAATKLKKYTVKVTGVVVDGVGSGMATCKKPSINWSVSVQ